MGDDGGYCKRSTFNGDRDRVPKVAGGSRSGGVSGSVVTATGEGNRSFGICRWGGEVGGGS